MLYITSEARPEFIQGGGSKKNVLNVYNYCLSVLSPSVYIHFIVNKHNYL